MAVGTLAFLSIGLLVGTVARTEQAAAAVANFVVLPMAFLSGWLQTVSQALPLRRQTDGMLDVLVRGRGQGRPRRCCRRPCWLASRSS